MGFFDAIGSLPTGALIAFIVALVIAFGFEFVNGFHDTANAVTTVIYTRSLPARPAVFYSGSLNFLGVLLGGTAVAFGIVNLLPVDLLVEARSGAALTMVMALLVSAVAWNLGTWYFGLPVSSSHTLIGSILGVGLTNSLLAGKGLTGVNWHEVQKAGLALLISPLLGFIGSALLLLVMRFIIRNPRLYVPPVGDEKPPLWIRIILILTCGGVSYAHGSNDGQKGMGLILLVLVGFLPVHYALTVTEPELAPKVVNSIADVRSAFQKSNSPIPNELEKDFKDIEEHLVGVQSYEQLPFDKDSRWEVRQHIFGANSKLKKLAGDETLPDDLRKTIDQQRKNYFARSIEFVPLWVVVGVALALGVGTTIGYKRIVVTVAEKIGKTHLTYAQGAAAETVAALTIYGAAYAGVPVSTTQVLSSGIAGTMVANKSGVQAATIKKIILAWCFTLPATIILSGVLFAIGRIFVA